MALFQHCWRAFIFHLLYLPHKQLNNHRLIFLTLPLLSQHIITSTRDQISQWVLSALNEVSFDNNRIFSLSTCHRLKSHSHSRALVKCYLSEYQKKYNTTPQNEYQSTKQAGLIALGLSKYELNQKLNSLVEWRVCVMRKKREGIYRCCCKSCMRAGN